MIQLSTNEDRERLTLKYGEEYICLKCSKVTSIKREICPECGGAICPRIKPQYKPQTPPAEEIKENEQGLLMYV